ncbi:serine hydrolase [Allokutzneria sp. NRRL B-24872]|uniref:serine hydrolase domain-containing protein n=1 Tax=Allokutzneria sp. NRRL B-24872 TaxID=1137961 RepID=UPI000A389CCF|nr:serine hydrolase domain-containing protein [Allokutzneria sp. NRRL B-24872]
MRRIHAWLTENLPSLIEEHGVPGASVAVVVDDEVVDVAAGVLNQGTGVAATTDSLFQIGSVTKLWTAALVMQLVEERVIGLDDPVTRHVPGLRLRDERVTIRQLLDHTSGLDGDVLTPTSRGDDAVALYADTVAPGLTQVIEPGSGFSYSNSGYVLLGRLVEVLRGKPFHVLLRERIADPLKLSHVATLPEEALLHRTAVGHFGQTPVPVWNLPASISPAGSLLCTSARSLAQFGAAHVHGHELLSEEAVTTLWSSTVDVPEIGSFATHWGLGWASFGWEGARVLGHDGGTIGQAAFLRVVPQAGVSVALLTNGGSTVGLFADAVLGHLLSDLAPVRQPSRLTPPAAPAPIDASLVTGAYSSPALRLEITVDGPVSATARVSAVSEETRLAMPEPMTKKMVRLDERRLISVEPGMGGRHEVYVFVGDNGPADYAFGGGRLLPRVG